MTRLSKLYTGRVASGQEVYQYITGRVDSGDPTQPDPGALT